MHIHHGFRGHNVFRFGRRNAVQGVVGVLVLCLAATASAEFISPLGIESVTAATDLSAAVQVINGSGLPDPEGNHAWGDFADSWVTDGIPGFPLKYDFSGQNPRLIIDLGGDIAFSAIHLWGYTFFAGSGRPQANSVKTFSLRFATEAEGPEGFGTSIPFNPTYNMDPDNVPSNFPSPGLLVPREDFSFGQVIVAAHVELSLLDNFWGDVQPGTGMLFDGGDRVGFGELRFSVPDAASLVLQLIDDVADAVATGELKYSHGRALTNKLESALRQLEKDNTAAVLGMLGGSIDQLGELAADGQVDPVLAEDLISDAEDIIEVLRFPASLDE